MTQHELRDSRRAPFFYVTVEAATMLRASFEGKQRTTARAIYDALCEVANEARSSEFEAGRQHIATYAGVTDRTLDAYARRFEALGLLEIERRRNGAMHLPNVWRLIEPKPRGGETKRPTPRSQTLHGGEAKDGRGGEANRTGFKKKNTEEGGKKILSFPKPEGGRKRSSTVPSHLDIGVRPA